MARPVKKLDESQIFELAAINCSMAEIASVMDCSPDTLQRRYAAVIEKGRDKCKMSLKRKQFEIAMGGNVTMLIWLGKIVLDQVEKREIGHTVSAIPLTIAPDEQDL